MSQFPPSITAMAAWTDTARSLGETQVRQLGSDLVERVAVVRNKLGRSRAGSAFRESEDGQCDRDDPLGGALRSLRDELMSCAAAINDDLVAVAVGLSRHKPGME
jgi:hypothetical protein